MKTIIAGSRNIADYEMLLEAVKASGFILSEIVSGHACGVDALGERYAKENNLPLKIFPAEWDLYGKSAGPRRNRLMAEYAQALIAIQMDNSRGTENMIREARGAGLKVYVKKVSSGELQP